MIFKHTFTWKPLVKDTFLHLQSLFCSLTWLLQETNKITWNSIFQKLYLLLIFSESSTTVSTHHPIFLAYLVCPVKTCQFKFKSSCGLSEFLQAKVKIVLICFL